MTVPVRIEDGTGGTTRQVKLSDQGELLTRPFENSSSTAITLDTKDVVFNFIEAKGQRKFLTTDIIVNADHFVSVNGADVLIYESDSPTSTTVLKTILSVDINRTETVALTGLHLDGSVGVYINAITSSASINLTIAGYFLSVPEISS